MRCTMSRSCCTCVWRAMISLEAACARIGVNTTTTASEYGSNKTMTNWECFWHRSPTKMGCARLASAMLIRRSCGNKVLQAGLTQAVHSTEKGRHRR